MLKLGIIGTNWITNQFVDAAIATQEYQLTAVYSRSIEKAQEFGAPYEVQHFFDQIDEFVSFFDVDVIYIASPNSLHFEQAKLALQAGKHVIVEKPAFSTEQEMVEIVKIAAENQVCFFEAARNIHEKSFQLIGEHLSDIGDILGADFTFMKYSSRYDAVLAGEEPNIFSLTFSGGAIMDLGVYLIYAAVGWFGVPQKVSYTAQKIRTGVDGMGTAILEYPQFQVTLLTGKIADSYLPSEIYGSNGTLQMNAVNSIDSIQRYDRASQDIINIPCAQEENPMTEEAADFAYVINHQDEEEAQASYQKWLQMAVEVNKILVALRKDAGIEFAADKKGR